MGRPPRFTTRHPSKFTVVAHFFSMQIRVVNLNGSLSILQPTTLLSLVLSLCPLSRARKAALRLKWFMFSFFEEIFSFKDISVKSLAMAIHSSQRN